MTLDPLEDFKAKAEDAVREAIASIGVDVELPKEMPPDGLGDFAFPCFLLAKETGSRPDEAAKQLAQKIKRDPVFSSIEAKGPYVNFHVNLQMFTYITVNGILASREEYGSHKPVGKSIVLEHTSANPTGPVHVGRARNPIIGDTLARILGRCGNEVITEFYVDDMGKQLVTLTWGSENLEHPDEAEDKADHRMVWFYQEANKLVESDPKVKEEIDCLVSAYEGGEGDISAKVHDNCQRVLDGMLRSLRRLDIHFDSFAWESKYVREGDVKNIVETLRGNDKTHDDGGALYIDLEEFGITGQENKAYLTRSDGSSLYSTRDMAYHLDKLARFDEAIDVLGEDHKLKARLVRIGLELAGSEKQPRVVFYSFVSLPEGKMSTRTGRVVYLDDLMEEAAVRARKEVDDRRPELAEELKRGIAEAVAMGAIRYNIIRVQAEKPIVFKWEEALNFEGNSAPFVQYSHARASSILRKASTLREYDATLLKHPSEIALIRALARFPTLIRQCGEKLTTHPIASYCYEVASLFNQFYRDCPVLTAETLALRDARLALVEATRWVLSNGLDTLGIVAPEEM